MVHPEPEATDDIQREEPEPERPEKLEEAADAESAPDDSITDPGRAASGDLVWRSALSFAAITATRRAARAAPPPSAPRDFLLVVFQRGGADGLCEVAFYNDPEYGQRRDTGDTRLYPPDTTPGAPRPQAIHLQGAPAALDAVGMAPALGALKPIYDAGKLAFIHACGSRDETRSHFDQQSKIERAEVSNPAQYRTPNLDGKGWLRRHLETTPTGTSLRAFSMTPYPVTSLIGAPGASPIADPTTFSFPTQPGDIASAQRQAAIQTMYAASTPALATAVQNDFGAITKLQNAFAIPFGSVVYPGSIFGGQMQQAAHLAKNIPDLEIIDLDLGGWDTHKAQGVTYDPAVPMSVKGRMDLLMEDLALSLAAFWADMQGSARSVCVLVMTEFGRTTDSNSGLGTDHARGGLCMLMGDYVNGGQVLFPTPWTGLPGGTADLDVGIDIRDIQGEIAVDCLGNTVANVIPDTNFPWTDRMLIT